ncbi:uncharacterized protein LOC103508261, partial [Diaphorina citri]|uniref:Uncharacterized protein LOC103508261 n=1 Tax=Diaphorina citri TaxID=121845 RepID=A0A3Q0IWE7_DIACI
GIGYNFDFKISYKFLNRFESHLRYGNTSLSIFRGDLIKNTLSTQFFSLLCPQGIGYNFDFKISYKFLNRFESHLRYGNTSLSIFRGDLIKNTYCDRLFYNCDKLKCRIQSPNYPGVYPRNVTCYYKIEHNIPCRIQSPNYPGVYPRNVTCYYKIEHNIPCRIQSPNYPGVYPRNVTCYYKIEHNIPLQNPNKSFKNPRFQILSTQFFSLLCPQGIGYNFDFKISYKFLNRFESHLRYGNTSLSIFRGDLIKNTYCDRLFYNCDKLKCRIQSPNYPGVYPRNVTCYYKIEHNIPVKNKQVLITVSQPKGHKINIKHQHIHDKTQRMLKVWDQCYVVQDYLTVYDGGTTLDPVLVRLCGGDVISYVDLKSNSYVQKSATSNGRRACNFHLTSFDTGWGMLSNPKHSLPPNTSCVYHFQGRSEERVWLSFVKYYAGESQQGAGLTNMAATGGEGLSNMVTSGGEGLSNMATVSGGECNTRLKIYDGRVGVSSTAQTTLSNTSILGDFCNRDDAMPRLCDHTLLSNRTRFTRPCNSHESYVSSSNEMTLELNMKLGSILYPLNFLLRYEFVSDTPDASVETSAPTDCFKRYNSKSSPLKGKLESTRSVFYFGRGGNENLTCIYRFDTNGTERIRLSVHKTRFNQRKCRTVNANCVYENRNELSELSIYEIPYDSFKIKRQCICESLNATIMVTSYMNSSLLLNFTVLHMNITQDYNHFSFDGDYEFLAQPDASEFNKTANIIQGKSGKINFNTALVGRKYNFPYLIVPEDNNNYLYLKISGFLIINHLFSTCNQKYLINVYTYFNSNREPIVICPMNYRSKVANSKASSKDLYFSPIEMFSYGWNNDINRSKLDLNVFNPLINSFILEFVPVNITSLAVRSDGLGFATGSEFDYMVEWIQVSKILAMNSYALTSSTMDCLYSCLPNRDVKITQNSFSETPALRNHMIHPPTHLSTVTSYMNSSLLLNFTVLHMNITQDYNHFSFDGDYEFLAQPDASEFNKTANIIQGKSGKINFNTALVGRKYNFPYLIVPEDNNNYLYLKISGFLIINHLFSTCNQKYLINVYTYFNSNREPIVICPMNYRSKVANSKASSKDLYFSPIEMFSYGWNNDINRSKLDLNVFNPLINSFILEFVPVNITSLAVRSDGLGFATGSEFDYMVEWIQVSKILAMNSYALTSSTMDCLYRCPEINACISAELWCDRKRHCPSGFDEEDANCSSLLALGSAPLLYLCVGAATLLALSCLIILTACVKFRRGNKQGSAVAGNKQSVQISASNHYHNGNSKKYLPSSDDYYMDVTVKDAGIC